MLKKDEDVKHVSKGLAEKGTSVAKLNEMAKAYKATVPATTTYTPATKSPERLKLEEEIRRKSYVQTFNENDGRRDFLDRIANRTADFRQQRRDRQNWKIDRYERKLGHLPQRADFSDLVEAGQQKAANGLFDRTNVRGKSFEEQGVTPEVRDDVFHQNVYDFMTPQQKSTYYAFLGLGDRQSANRYLNSIENGLQQQAAQKLTDTIKPGNIENVQDFVDVMRLSIGAGVDGVDSAIFDQLGRSDAATKSYKEQAFEEARPNMTGATAIVADVGNTIGFQLIPAAGSVVLGAVGVPLAVVRNLTSAFFGVAAGARTYRDLLLEDPGVDKFSATVYSIVNGALEGTLERVLGGVRAFSGGGLSKIGGKIAAGTGLEKAVAQKLMNVSKACANTPAVKALVRALVAGGKGVGSATDEAVEEWLQAVLDPIVQNYVLGRDNEVQLFGEEQLYAAMLGAIGSAVMNAPSIGSDFVNADSILAKAVMGKPSKNANRSNAAPQAADIPEIPAEQLAAYADDKAVTDLQEDIARLQAELALEKKGRHRNNIQNTINARKKALAELIAKKSKAKAKTEQAPAATEQQAEDLDSLGFLQQELDKIEQPVEENQQPVEQQQPVEEELTAEDEQRQLEELQRKFEEQKAKNAKREAELIEKKRQTDQKIERLTELLNSDKEITQEDIDQALEEPETEEQQAKDPVAVFNEAIEEAKMYGKYMSREEFGQLVRNAQNNFRENAKNAGMSEQEIEAQVAAYRNNLLEIYNSLKEGSEERDIPVPTKSSEKAAKEAEQAWQANQTEQVSDEDIDEALGKLPTAQTKEVKPATDSMARIADVAEAAANEEMDVDEASDEIVNLLNERDAEREASGETIGEAGEKTQLGEYTNKPSNEPQVSVADGRIEVKYPKYPGKNVTKELKKAGFKWDDKAKVWWSGDNNTNRTEIEKLTNAKLTEDGFEPKVRRIPKEVADNEKISGKNAGRKSSLNDGNGMVELGRKSTSDAREIRRIDARKRGNAVRKLSIKAQPAKEFYTISDKNYSVSGEVKILPDSFIETVDKNSREWELYADAYEKARQNGTKAKIKLYAGSILLNDKRNGNSTKVDAFFDEDSNTIWLNVSDEEFEDGIYDHEEFHSYVSEDLRALDVAVEALRKATGITRAQLKTIVERVVIPGWGEVFGKLNTDVNDPNYNFDRYIEEFMCNVYGGAYSDLLADITGKKLGVISNYDSAVEAVHKAVLDFMANRNPAGAISRKNGNIWIPSRNANLREHLTSAKRGDTIAEVQNYLESLPDEDRNYIQESLTDTYNDTYRRIVNKGVDNVFSTLMNVKNWTAPQMNEATVLVTALARAGDDVSVRALLPKYLEQQKNLGQAINAFKLLRKYMPGAVSAVTQSIANEIDVELTDEEKADIALCDRIIEQGFISNSVLNNASETLKDWLTEARRYLDRGQLDAETAAYAAAMTIVTAKQPATARQKFRSLQRISLLSNPKTHFRNILGNLAEQAGAVMSRPVADLTDRFLYKLTGNRTFGAGGGKAFAKAFADSIERAVMDHALGINTVGNKFDEDTTGRKGLQQLVQRDAWDEHTKNEFRNGVAKIANNIDHLIGLGLSVGDAPFLITTYESALAQIMNANNVEEATAEMMDTAWDVAYRRTFRDENDVTKALSGIRNSLPFIGETIAPYVQTPVNVVLTAIQYSPIGFGEAFCKAFIDVGGNHSLKTQLKNGESTMKTQRQIAELVGRGALGTACMLAGALLASAGHITGDDDDIDSQKEKNWNRAVGRTGSSIKIGNTYIDPSSLQSLSTPIMAGAAAYEGKQEEDGMDWGGILGAAVKASMKMGNTMLEMPVLQGVADLFSGNYDNGELLAGALGLAGNAATQVVPFGSLLKQGAKVVDPYSRVQSEINAGPLERVGKNTVNNLRSMIPTKWGREKLSKRYDVLGNPIKNDASDNFVERVYNSLINPFNTSKDKSNEVTDEIDRLYEALGKDTDVLPTAAGNSVSYGGEQYKFTSAEKQEYQRIEGESNSEILTSLVNSDAYDKLSDEDRAKVLESVYKYSAEQAKKAYFKKKDVEYEGGDAWISKIDDIVATGVDIGDALVYRYELKDIDGSDNQVFYINELPLNSEQKTALDEAFVDKYRTSYIDETRDYTNNDTLALSMTSESAREKYDNRFSKSWRGSSGNTYGAMTGEQFGHFYDAYYSGSNVSERVAAIKQMLMELYELSESDAYKLAVDFRKYYAAKYD